MAERAVRRTWVTATLIVVTYLVAGALNARELVFGLRPDLAGTVGSCLYLIAWSLHAFSVGRILGCGALRRMAVIWAVIIGGTAICGTLLRLNLGNGGTIAGGWVVPAILVVVAAPLYGLAAAFGPDPLAVLVAVAVASATLTIGVALAARRWSAVEAPATSAGAANRVSGE